jgi:hypothetical protein
MIVAVDEADDLFAGVEEENAATRHATARREDLLIHLALTLFPVAPGTRRWRGRFRGTCAPFLAATTQAPLSSRSDNGLGCPPLAEQGYSGRTVSVRLAAPTPAFGRHFLLRAPRSGPAARGRPRETPGVVRSSARAGETELGSRRWSIRFEPVPCWGRRQRWGRRAPQRRARKGRNP